MELFQNKQIPLEIKEKIEFLSSELELDIYLLKKFIYFLIEEWLLYRILLFSVKPQHESAMGIHTYILSSMNPPPVLFPIQPL